MAKPTSKVLVINDEPLILKEFPELNARRVPWKIPRHHVHRGADGQGGIELIERDGDVQIVIVDRQAFTR